MNESGRAVFLSYASQDADAARRIAQALRAEGVEVWFDESELRGGEAWDASIQRQIGECALFVAIVSAHTQARREGYFRLEWRLADERLRLMAEGTPFLLPVIVDTTKERDALVPKSFLGVQWTWLPHGEVPPAWVARVQKLIGGPAAALAAKTETSVSVAPTATHVVAPVAEAAKAAAKQLLWWRWLPWGVAIAASGMAVWLGVRPGAVPPAATASFPLLRVTHSTLLLPTDAPLAPTWALPLGVTYPSLALSPDGTNLVYVALIEKKTEKKAETVTQLYRRPMDRPVAQPIPHTEGAYFPFFSPDSRWVGFFANDKLKKISILGGAPVELCESGKEVLAACWGDDGAIYFTDTPTLYRVSERGGDRQPILDQESRTTRLTTPEILPGSKVLIGSFISPAYSHSGDYTPLLAQSLTTKVQTMLVERGYNPRFIPPGYLVFARTGSLYAAALDAGHVRMVGEPVPLVDGVSGNALLRVAHYTVSATGTLVYAEGSALHRSSPIWVDRNGVESLPLRPAQTYGHFRLSPDGGHFAMLVPDVRDNLWIFDAKTGEGNPLTEDGVNRSPVWRPTGRRLIFMSSRGPTHRIYEKNLTAGSEPATLLYEAPDTDTRLDAQDVSPDSRVLVINTRAGGKTESMALLLDGSGKTERLNLPENAQFIRFSPDGRWLSFAAGRRYEVFIRAYPDGPQHPISFDGGEAAIWSRKGDELFYRNRDTWMVATLTFEPEFSVSRRKLFSGPYLNVLGYDYDVAPDGQRFLVLKSEHQETPISQLHVITNWTEELKRRVPAGGGKGR